MHLLSYKRRKTKSLNLVALNILSLKPDEVVFFFHLRHVSQKPLYGTDQNRSNQTKLDFTKPSSTKPNQTHSFLVAQHFYRPDCFLNSTRPNQTHTYQTKLNQTKPNKANLSKSSQTSQSNFDQTKL